LAVTDFSDKLSIPAELTQVRIAADWLANLGVTHQIPAAKLMNLDLCLDESLMNVIMHGSAAGHSSPIELVFELHQRDLEVQALVTVSDGGAPFDPLAVAQRPLATSLDDANIGGLGLIILRSNAMHLNYRFDNGRNHLTFGQSWLDNTCKNTAPDQAA